MKNPLSPLVITEEKYFTDRTIWAGPLIEFCQLSGPQKSAAANQIKIRSRAKHKLLLNLVEKKQRIHKSPVSRESERKCER